MPFFIFNSLKYTLLIFIFLFQTFSVAQTLEKEVEKITARLNKDESVSLLEYERILKTHANQFDTDPDNAARLYYYYGENLYNALKVNEATESYSQAYNYSIKAKDTSLKYIAVLAFARVSFYLEDYIKAEDYYLYALPGIAPYLGQSSIAYTKIYYEYVKLLMATKRYAEAKPSLEALVYYFKTLNLLNDPVYHVVLGHQAVILQEEGKYKEASDKYQELLDNDKVLKSGDTTGHFIISINLADLHRQMGEYELALLQLKTLKRQMIQFRHQRSVEYGRLENILGLTYKALNDLKNAEEVYDNAIALYKELQMERSESYCTVLSNKADLMRWLGRREEGFKLLNSALEVRKQNFGDSTESYANTLSNYGLIAFDEGEYGVAQSYFENAFKIYEKTTTPTSQSYANCLNNLSGCYYQSGDHKKAADYKFKAIQIIESTLGKQHFKYISYVLGSTDVLVANKEYEKAYRLLNESKSLAKSKFGADHDLYIRSLINQAYVCWLMNRAEESLNLYEEAIAHKLNSLTNFFYAMNRNNQVYYLEEIQDEMFVYGSTLFSCREKFPKLNLNAHFETYFNDQLILKSLLNTSTAEWQRQIVTHTDPKIKLEYTRWLKLKNDLNDLYKTDFTAEQQDMLTTQINDLETYLKKMVEVKPITKLTFKTIKDQLKPSEAIVDVTWYNNLDGDSTSNERYTALVIKANSLSPECVLIGNDRFDAYKALAYYNEQMDKELRDSVSYNVFFQKIAAQLKGVKRVYVSCKGVYNKINFETLYDQRTKKYVLDEMDIVYLPNLNSIPTLTNTGNSQLTAELLGNPDFNYDFRKRSTKTEQPKTELLAKRFGLTEIAELPGTETELSKIETALKANKWRVETFTRENANEENVQKVKSPKLLHIATHGYFLKSVESEDTKFLGFNTQAFMQLEDMRSGLILAGAAINTQDSVLVEANKDGILTAREASVLNLTNTDLVVLSACQTGLAIETFNAGVIGLQQAFSNAGAKNLIVSLWPVDDNATQLLMTKFYQHWVQNSSNEGISAAFKKAQLEVKKEYPHPFYWGAFVLLRN